jgi:hypothetical protein
VAGSEAYPDAYLLTVANAIAGILDQDGDGKDSLRRCSHFCTTMYDFFLGDYL